MRPRTIVGVGAALLVVLAAGGTLLRVAVGDAGDGRGASSDERERAAAAETSARAGIARRPVELVLDTNAIDPDKFWPAVTVVDELAEVATRLVLVRTGRTVLLRQCQLDGEDTIVACAPAIAATPKDFEDTVVTLVELLATFRAVGGSRVDCRVERCALVVHPEEDGDGPLVQLAGAELVFGGAAPPGSIEVTTRVPVGQDDEIAVRLKGFPAGDRVTIGWCSPPGPVDRAACGEPAPTATVTIGADGTASASLDVPAEDEGPGTRTCSARRPCAVAVVDADRQATFAVAKVAFVGAPGPDLPAGRLLAGLGLALALLIGALVLARRTDWQEAGADPFLGVSLAVPEWDAISLDDDPADELEPATS